VHHIKVTFDKFKDALNQVLGDNTSLLKKTVRSGPKYKFTDIDVIALSLTADYINAGSENYLFAALNSDYKNDFPNLLSRRQYNHRRKRLEKPIKNLRELISIKMEPARKTQDIYVIDSMPLRVTKFARRNSSTICRDDANLVPQISKCAAQDEWYYGFKLHAVCTGDGIIKAFKIDDSTIHDVHYLDEIGEQFKNCRIVGDKGYISQSRKKELFEDFNIYMETPPKKNQKNQPIFIWGKVRKTIERLFSQINGQFDIQKNYAKTVRGYVTRLYSKLCTLTLLQFVNKSKGRTIGRLKYALL
jgi:hypothetical protein